MLPRGLSSSEELEVALKAVEHGSTFLSPTVSRQVMRGYVRRIDVSTPDLMPRQRDVVRLIAGELASKEIACHVYRVARPDGTTCWILDQTRRVDDEAGWPER